jgi:predicted RNA-binding Zn-ribbon protein involved in translation (DUF1610 family)
MPRTYLACDFCGTHEPALWYFPHLSFELLNGLTLVDVPAGEAGTCSGCLRLVEARDAAAVLQRSMALLKADPGAARLIGAFQHMMLGALTGQKRFMHAAAYPSELQFFEYRCPRCGEAMVFDSHTYRESVERPCPLCGLRITIAGRLYVKATS